MKHLLTLLFICIRLVASAQDEAIAEQETVIVIKDARLDILNSRPEAIRLALDAAKAKVKEPVVYGAIKAGKKTVTGSITQKQGFRVQIYTGPDRLAAMKIKSSFNKMFPGTRSYMSYNPPNFKIKVGDFEDKKEASQFMKRMQGIAPTATVLPDVVTIKNILVQ
jgi:hypothetical protein